MIISSKEKQRILKAMESLLSECESLIKSEFEGTVEYEKKLNGKALVQARKTIKFLKK